MKREEYLEKVRKCTDYQELHVHSEGSYRDAANTVNDIFDESEALGRNAVAITDHGNFTRVFAAMKEQTKREKACLEKELTAAGANPDEIKAVLKSMGAFGTIRNPDEQMWPIIEKYEDAFLNTAKKTVKFILGIEMYEANPVEDDKHRYHIILYAKDWEGAQVLFTMCNKAQLNRYRDMPRLTIKDLEFFCGPGTRGHDKIIVTSACMAGHIQSIILRPYRIAEEQEKLRDKMDAMTITPPEAIEEFSRTIEANEVEIHELSEKVREMKKAAAKKTEKAVERAQIALEKAMAKYPAGQVSMFGEQQEHAKVLEAREKLEKAKELDSLKKESADKLPEAALNLDRMKAKLKERKAVLVDMNKKNAPVLKIQEKIDILEEEASNLGDVYESAKALAIEYDRILGRGNFYLELQNHGIPEEYVIRENLIRISRETGIPMTVANDVHYRNLKNKRKRDLIAAMRFLSDKDQKSLSDVENRVGNDALWFKPNSMMKELFANVPEAIENTNRIAEQCNVFYKKEMHLPEFVDVKWGLTPEKYLRKISYDGIKKRFPDYDDWDKERKDKFIERLEYELGIINTMNFPSYIAMVEDFITFGKTHYGEDSIGPGRGSGAGSLVCYLIGITNIDPLRYNLIFERFLNPERVSMPDIDTDFGEECRKGTIEYVAERYRYKKPYWVPELSGTVCNILAEGTLAARKSIRQVGKVIGAPLSLCDKVAKMVPAVPGITLKQALEKSPELAQLYRDDADVKKLIDDAMLVEGVPDQVGVHAAGVIIADKPISEYAPMFWNEKKQCWVIEYDMVACEGDLGMLKMDFLGLKNLDIITRTKKYIKSTKGKIISFARDIAPADDANVIHDVYAAGNTDGTFQFESGGMKQMLCSFMPTSIEDVIAMNAAYRPGPMQYIPEITDVKLGKKEADYIIPELKSILGPTYGAPIYQEQIQQIFHNIAGCSLGQADVIRRAMSKKHLDELEAAKSDFVKGFKEKGATDADIEKFWTQLLEFAKYAFNKSHAAAYSVLSYYTAYLKYYYPAEYMASLMSYSAKEDLPVYIKDAKDYGVEVLPPDINRSVVFTAPTRNNGIRIGLDGLKDMGATAPVIVKERKKRGPYKSASDLLVRAYIAGIDKSALDSLVKSGAAQGMELPIENRQEFSENLAYYIRSTKVAAERYLREHPEVNGMEQDERENILYQYLSENLILIPETRCEDYSYLEMLHIEKEYAGFYVSGNPLDKHKDLMRRYTKTQISECEEETKESVTLSGYISDFTLLRRKSDGKEMCKFTLEDFSGSIEAICFAYHYEKLKSQFQEGGIVVIKGVVKIDFDDDGNIHSRQIVIEAGRRLA